MKRLLVLILVLTLLVVTGTLVSADAKNTSNKIERHYQNIPDNGLNNTEA